MNKIIELRKKRAEVWDRAKAFLDIKRGDDGLISAEDNTTYEKMEKEVVNLGKEIERLERQQAIDLELSKAVNDTLVSKPSTTVDKASIARQRNIQFSSLSIEEQLNFVPTRCINLASCFGEQTSR